MSHFLHKALLTMSALIMFLVVSGAYAAPSYVIVDSGQNQCFNDSRQIKCPEPGEPFNGQDAQYKGNQPAYTDNGDGTVTDNNSGLMWIKARGDKVSWNQAMADAGTCRAGGYSDWRAPTIKELYSLMDFNGWVQGSARDSTPFINTRYFDFKYGETDKGERIIDCQDWSSTEYRGTTMNGNPTVFGVNFADGRIKGYGKSSPRGTNKLYIRYVRGNPRYGQNVFVDNHDGTISDTATGLIWQQKDSGTKYRWEQALGYCEDLTLAGRSDWRLPSVKELQSIVDYTRSPTSTHSAAIDPVFGVTDIESYYLSSTTHMDGPKPSHACYLAFGRAMGYFAPPRSSGSKRLMDVHGAGAQRSDPKNGDPAQFPQGHGPQGDDIRIFNSVRCVTDGGVMYHEPPYSSLGTWKGTGPGGAGSGKNWSQGQGRQQDPNMMRQGQGMGMGQGQPMTSGGNPGPEMFIQRHDMNGDGVVSKEEFPGPPQHFQQFDRNNDGVIELDEAPTGPPTGRP